jgi:alkylation response protein AidB-like acyl-CoA dehydrogenase
MYRSVTTEQELLIEAAQGALGRVDTLAGARAALDGLPAPALWELASEAGWTGLLSDEALEGAGLGAHEAALLLEVCGRRLADAHLLGHLPAAALIEAAAADDELRTAVATGARRAALLATDCSGPGEELTASDDDGEVIVSGAQRAVLDAPGADVLVLVGRDARGALVAGHCDAPAPGLTMYAVEPYDATRSLADVTLDRVALRPLNASAGQISAAAALQQLLLAAESVGAADACLQMARDYALERAAFGRQIGSFQAIKHKLVEMLRQIENARSLLIGAGRAFEGERGQFELLANAARVTAGDALDYCSAENIFIHGGIGATWEHDAHLYYRRAELSRRLAGGPDGPAERVSLVLEAAR